MMKPLKLSHTKIEMMKECGAKYDNHYNKYIRSTTIKSSLFFGSKLESGLEYLLKAKQDGKKITSNILTEACQVFNKNMSFIEINGVKEKTSGNDKIIYSKKDPNFSGLLFKGECMIIAYANEILPNLVKIHSIQKRIELTNEDGDKFPGIIDLIADWQTLGNTVVFDNKTSSQRYHSNAVRTKPQLSIYSEHEGIDQAGYIVIGKNLIEKRIKRCKTCGSQNNLKAKRCTNGISHTSTENDNRCNGELEEETLPPKADIQVLIDKINNDDKELVFNDIQIHATAIKNEEFTPNFKSCFSFGSKCTYYDYCRNGSKEGLMKLKKRDKNDKIINK